MKMDQPVEFNDDDADGIIGMDHPLFMASAQASIDAHFAVNAGIPIEEALPKIIERMLDLFGDVPVGMIEERVRGVFEERAR
jgi:hypothetical protein